MNRLRPAMYRLAREVAEQRAEFAASSHLTQAHGYDGDRLALDLRGAMAEAFVSQEYGIECDGVRIEGDWTEPDVGWVDVRSTSYSNGCLLLHEDSPEGRIFVLVIIPETAPWASLWIPGWCYGREGKLPRFWRDDVRSPAYFVPQSHLHDPTTLLEERCLVL